MNELAVRASIKDLINTNKSTLVTGLTKQGQSRTLSQLTYSILTAPKAFYFMNVTVSDARTRNRSGFGRTTALTLSEAEYDVVLEVGDYAVLTSGEDEPYEKVDADFQRFTDRVVSLLRESYWVSDATTGLQFRLTEDRSVNKSNLSSFWQDAENYHALLYARITFTLIEECTDDTKLY